MADIQAKSGILLRYRPFQPLRFTGLQIGVLEAITPESGSSGKRVPARRERTSSVCCELALWGLFEFLALKGLHRVAQGLEQALGRTKRPGA